MKYAKINKDRISEEYNHKYKQIREYEYPSAIAKNMAKWSIERIIEQFKEDGKIWN